MNIYYWCSYALYYYQYFKIYNYSFKIIAHEIGHNLGMQHDFGATTSDPRFSSQNEACTGIGGYMDYQPNPSRWSPCSVEDFTGYFESVNTWCLTPRKIFMIFFRKDIQSA